MIFKKIFLLLSVVFVVVVVNFNLHTIVHATVCDSDCSSACNGSGTTINFGCCTPPFDFMCMTVQDGLQASACYGGSSLPTNSCNDLGSFLECPDTRERIYAFGYQTACSSADSCPTCGGVCHCFTNHWTQPSCAAAGLNPSSPIPSCGGSGGTVDCEMRNLVCPATCTIGQNFNISYDYRNTNYLVKPNISQRIADVSYNNLWCLADQTINDNAWHNAVRSVLCTETIRVGGHSNAGHWTDWCDYSWSNAQIGCSLTCNLTPVPAIPPAIGYVKVKHPLGILSLRLISFSDALSFLRGIFKIARFGGDTNAAADLVETTDSNASPVRVKTPYGIKAWRKAP